MATLRTTLILCLCLLGGGCGFATVGVLHPSPMVELPRGTLPLRLSLGGVQDTFQIPQQEGFIQVTDWRRSIENGFRYGFRHSFVIVAADSPARAYTLEVPETRVDVQQAPSRMAYQPTGTLYTGRLRFRARLLDPTGRDVGRSFGMVTASRTVGRTDDGTQDLSPLLRDLIERMVEQVAHDCPMNDPPTNGCSVACRFILGDVAVDQRSTTATSHVAVAVKVNDNDNDND